MNVEFWVSTVRDLVLLGLGSAFTLLGTWLANRHAARENAKARDHEAHEHKLDRDESRLDSRRAEDVERGKELLRVIARFEDFIERGDEDQAFPEDLIAAADDIGILVHNAEGREAITNGIQLTYSWEILRQTGRGIEIEESQSGHRWKTYRALRSAAGALARQDPIPDGDRTWLLQNVSELEAAWSDKLAEQDDWRRANAAE